MMRPLMERRLLAALALCALLLAAGAADARPDGSSRGGESFGGGSFGAHERTTSLDIGSSSLSPVSPLPSRAPLYRMASPSVDEGQIGAVPNPGPVTGYGSGGMIHSPGTPANPPY